MSILVKIGLFGNQTGLISAECSSSCWEGGCVDSLCQEGYYCPPGSTVATQAECGDNGENFIVLTKRVHAVHTYLYKQVCVNGLC